MRADREVKYLLAGFGLWALFCVAVNIAIIYAIIHFVVKYW